MAKRFFISLLLVAVVVAAVAAGAAYLFRGSYESLAALQAQGFSLKACLPKKRGGVSV